MLLEKQKAEIWKDIPGYEGIYQASSFGRIRTAPGKTTSNARYDSRVWKSRIMRFKVQGKGGRKDARVELWKGGEHATFLSARLICSAFHGEKIGMTVNHIDGNTMNNRPDKLEWVSIQENITKAFQDGLYDSICRPIVLFETETGTEHRFRSMAEAGRAIGRSHGYISQIAKSKRNAVGSDGSVYRLVLKE